MVGVPDRRLLEVIETLHRSALEPGVWQTLWRDIAGLLDSPGCALTFHDLRTNKATFADNAYSANEFSKQFLADYVREFSTGSLLVQDMLHHPIGTVYRDKMFGDLSRHHKSPIYNELLLPTGTANGIFYILSRDQREMVYLGIRRDGSYGDDAAALVHHVGVHLRHALDLRLRMGEVELMGQSLADAWDRIQRPMVLVNGAGAVMFANRAAKAILDRADGLSLHRGGVLAAATPADTRRLQSLIHGVVQADPPPSPGAVLSLARPSGARPLGISIAPVARRTNEEYFLADGLRPRAALFIADPDDPAPIAAPALAIALGLTDREAQVVALLAGNRTIADIARDLSLTEGTVRSYLKVIMRKTGTARQNELVRLAMDCLPPTVGATVTANEEGS